MKKAKVKFNKFSREIEMKFNTIKINKVNIYVYLVQLVITLNSKTDEIKRGIVAGWITFKKNRDNEK